MKKIINILIVLTMVLSVGLVSYADEKIDDESVIVIESHDEIKNYKFELGKSKRFFIPDKNGIGMQAICYVCGSPGLGFGKLTENTDIDLFNCPERTQFNSDHLLTFETYNSERCTYCVHTLKLEYLYTEWVARCYAETFDPLYAWTDYDVILDSCPVCDGLNGHQCIDPDDPQENPYERHNMYH